MQVRWVDQTQYPMIVVASLSAVPQSCRTPLPNQYLDCMLLAVYTHTNTHTKHTHTKHTHTKHTHTHKTHTHKTHTHNTHTKHTHTKNTHKKKKNTHTKKHTKKKNTHTQKTHTQNTHTHTSPFATTSVAVKCREGVEFACFRPIVICPLL